MRFFHKVICGLALVFTFNAKAFTPESGFWWNPDESGSGYAIEIQDNFLFVALYVYDEVTGEPIWYTAGDYLQGNAYFDSGLNYSYDGTCIDCAYSQPITIIGERGPITINFQTETTATIQFQGAVKNIERFNFILGDEFEKMLGEWQIIVDQSNIYNLVNPYFADALIFEYAGYDSGLGFEIAEGCRSESTYFYHYCTNYAYDNNTVIAYIDNDGFLYVVVEHDPDHFLTYKLDVGLNQFDGRAYYYLRGTIPELDDENGFLTRGFRTASRSFVETGVGPSKVTAKSKKEDNTDERANVLKLSKVLNEQEYIDLKDKSTHKIIKQLELYIEMNKRLKK